MPTDTDLHHIELEQKLADLYPEEVAFFKEVFIWSGCKEGFYVRSAYEEQKMGDMTIRKWSPLQTRGNWQKLYTKLVASLTEKHLDFERFTRTRELDDRLRPKDSETAFWVGTMAGPNTRTHAIDLDAHEYIGWYSVPTRWHSSRTGYTDGPSSYRNIPVIRPNLKFFMTARVIHNNFPNRIWAFSSGNLGLSVWRILRCAQTTATVYEQQSRRLETVGLAGIEHYPCPPKTPDSFGRCHRRPCGADSGIITPEGVITDPIEQIRWFIRPQGVPSFDHILSAYWQGLETMYAQFIANGGGPHHERMPLHQKQALVDDCWRVVEGIKDWARSGCPIDHELLAPSHQPKPDPEPELVTHMLNRTEESSCNKESSISLQTFPRPDHDELIPESFHAVDLPMIIRNKQWVQFVRFLIFHGFPQEDKFFDIISTLAKWFVLVELCDYPRKEITELLHQYVLNKHNGMISRLNNGEETEVLSNVDRIVDYVLDNETEAGLATFEDLRTRRASGSYKQVWYFAPEIMGHDGGHPTDPVCLVDHKDTDAEGASEPQAKWQYVPDDTPLPMAIVKLIREAFRKRKRQLRKNKDGRFPTLDAITRLCNYLLAGRTPGKRRASKELLIKMGFPSNGSKRERIIKLLIKEGLLERGGYRIHISSREWTLLNVEKYHRDIDVYV